MPSLFAVDDVVWLEPSSCSTVVDIVWLVYPFSSVVTISLVVVVLPSGFSVTV